MTDNRYTIIIDYQQASLLYNLLLRHSIALESVWDDERYKPDTPAMLAIRSEIILTNGLKKSVTIIRDKLYEGKP